MAEPEWTPTTEDVAAHIRARVKTAGGGEVNDFTTETRPTKAQVEKLITRSVDEVVTKIGTLETCESDRVEDLRDAAGTLAAVRAAMRVERAYWPEQIGSDRSPYDALKEEWEDSSKTLIEAVAENCGSGGGGESVGGSGAMPNSDFPDATNWGTADI